MDELLRTLTPAVIAVLVHRGADFATAEDAVQDALSQAARIWPDDRPPTPRDGWSPWPGVSSSKPPSRGLASRPGAAGRGEPPPGPGETADDTLQLYFLCAHPSLTPASAVALTLRAVGGLTTRQIAQAYLVPEATMAQRISRAKRTVGEVRFKQPGDVATVLRVLYLVFNEGYSGDVDLAAEAIRLTRQLAPRPIRGVGGTAGVDAAPSRPATGADPARWQPGAPRRAGPQPVEYPLDRRGR